ncbi:hypothetical protein JZ751_022347, partial [Albula glossodonta]
MSRPCDLDKQEVAFKPRAKNAVDTNTHGDVTDVEIERLQLESSPSPPSSSAKMDPPSRTSGNVPPDPRIQQERPPSPTQSYLSIRTDRSMDQPVSFNEGFACEPRSFYGSCDFCTERKLRAVKSCLTCTASYCETHLRQHSLVSVRQRHTLVEATGNLEYRLCPQHHRALELFCNTDQMPICSLCLTLTHRGHDVVCSEPGTQNDSYTKTVNEWIVQHHLTQASAGGMDTQSLKFRVTCISDTKQRSFNVTGANHTNIQSLRPGKEYTFTVVTIGDKGTQSRSVSATVSTVIPAPVGLTIDSVTMTSFSLRWREPHGLDQTPSFLVSTCSPGTEPQFISTELHSTVLSNLQPGRQYTASVCTVLENGEQSEAVSKTLYTGSLRVEGVKSRSVWLCWDKPTDMERVSYTFSITYTCDGEEPRELTTESNSSTADLCDLKPGMEYSFSICTVLHNGIRSRVCSARAHTKPSPPGRLRVEEVRSRSARLCWDTPTDIEGVSYTFSIIYTCDGEKPRELTTGSNSNTADLCDLKPGMEYSFSICTVLHNGTRSRVCSARAHTKPSPPESLNICYVSDTSLCLSWDRQTYMEGVPHTFRVTWGGSTAQRKSITADENFTVLSHLRPVTEYSISVCTVLQSYSVESEPVHTTVCTKPSPPKRLRVEEVKSRSVTLCWDKPTNMEGVSYTFSIIHTLKKVNYLFVSSKSVCLSYYRNPYLEGVPHTFSVTWGESTGQRKSITADENLIVLSYLRPGTEYSISVWAVLQSYSLKSRPVHTTVCTRVPSPTHFPNVITYTCDGEEPRELTAESNINTADLCDLKPGMEYSFSICTVLHNDIRSRVCSTHAHTMREAGEVSVIDTPGLLDAGH